MSSGIPRTLDECFIALKGLLGEEGVSEFEDLAANEVSRCHHGLGRRIRNAWGLWSGSELKTHLESRGLTHADDMSTVILTSFWRHIHKLPLDVEAQVEHFQNFWRQQRGSP